MKNQIKIIAFVFSLLMAQHSQANNRCMPAVLDFVMQDFDNGLQTTGLIVEDRNGLTVNLGKNLSQNSVKISDVHKNSYRLDIPLEFIDHHSTNVVVRTYVMIEDYINCRITTKKITYDFYETLN